MLTSLPRRLVPVALALAMGLHATPSRAEDGSARWIAMLPFGVGQMYRGDTRLAVFFAAGEALLGGTSVATMAWVNARASANTSPPGPGQLPVDHAAINAEIQTATMVNRLAFAGWAALTAAGIIEAQVNLPSRRSAPRDQPAPPAHLTAAPVPGGASVGLRVAF